MVNLAKALRLGFGDTAIVATDIINAWAIN